MFDEPENGKLRLVGVNDLSKDAFVSYSVKKLSLQGEDSVMLSGQKILSGDEAQTMQWLSIEDGEKEFYLIEWEYNGISYKNTYVTNLIDIDYRWYLTMMEKCGINTFEGF